MTKAAERGENEFTDAARKEAARTGEDLCAILRRWLSQAKRNKDGPRVRKLQQAEKFLGCRNKSKRGTK